MAFLVTPCANHFDRFPFLSEHLCYRKTFKVLCECWPGIIQTLKVTNKPSRFCAKICANNQQPSIILNMARTYDPLLPETYYHIYNRAVGSELLFKNEDNYHFFLERVKTYSSPVCSFYAYCLMPNHFHFLMQVKNFEAIQHYYTEKKGKKLVYDNGLITDFVMEQFSNAFNSYTKAFNKMHDRKGKLFMDHLHRKEVSTDTYFTKVIHYIHANVLHHGLVKDISAWPYSSYNTMLRNSPTYIERGKVLEWFGGVEEYIAFHKQPVEIRTP